jgi:polyisoprenoid-binding protein YceI
MAGIQELLGNPESAGVWRVVPEQPTIGFKTKSMWGLVPVKGRLKKFSGDGQITDTQTVFGRVDIKAASLDTKMRKRDEDLRSEKFFDVAKFPDISVVVTSAETIEGDSVVLRAQLTVKRTTAPLLLRAKVAVRDDGTVRLTTQTTIDRKDFGVEGNLMGMVVDKTAISGDVVFRQAAG